MEHTFGKYPSVNTEHKDVFPHAPSPTITSFLYFEISFGITAGVSQPQLIGQGDYLRIASLDRLG